MKPNKKWLIVAGIVISIVIFGGLAASSTWGPGKNPDAQNHCGFAHSRLHSGAAGEHLSDFMLWRLDRMADQLDLTNSQNEQYTELRTKIKSQLAEGLKAHQALEQTMRTEILQQTPDMANLSEALKTTVQAMAQGISENIDQFTLFYEILDAQQQAKIAANIREKFDRHQSIDPVTDSAIDPNGPCEE